MSARRRPTPGAKLLWWAAVLLASVLIWAPVSRADDGIQAAVVIIFPDRTESYCVTVQASPARGIDVLQAAGLRLVTQASPGMGSAVCKIEGIGCDFPGEDCFCECVGQPCNYWNYWYLVNGAWVHSPLGASNREVANGAVECWLWGPETQQPPAISLTDICVAEAPTATFSPTATPAATHTPPPTQTAIPTDTPLVSPTATSMPTASATHTPAQSATITPTSNATMTVTPTSTATSTRTLTPAQPTPTVTPYSPYGYDGTPTITRTRTRTATPTQTRTPTRTPVWTWTPMPTITLGPTPTPMLALPTQILPPGLYPSPNDMVPTDAALTPTATPHMLIVPAPSLYPAPGLVAAYPSPAARDPAAPEPTSVLEAGVLLATEDGAGAYPGPLLEADPETDARVARLVNTAVARSQGRPQGQSPQRPERQAPRAYGAFVALLSLLVLLGLYIWSVRRQRREQRAAEVYDE